MDQIYATKTFAKYELPDQGSFVAKAEIVSRSGQRPYFGVTGDLRERGKWVAGGCMHDEVREYFPELAPYLRWHLTSTDGPMHYLANAMYHAGFCLGMESRRNLEYLASTIIYGAVEGDTAVDLEKLDGSSLLVFLTNRFPALMQQFKADMAALFGEIPNLPEVASEPYPYTFTRISTPESREALRQKKRQDLINSAQKDAQERETELAGKLWAFDHGLNIDNLIYYKHRDIFTFGWRNLVTDAEKSAILDVISEFPYEYEIKTAQGVLSGRS